MAYCEDNITVIQQRLGHENSHFNEEEALNEYGIITEKPMLPKYSSLKSRVKSFEGKQFPVSAEDLAHAGFVYTGMGDIVKCFYCGGELKNWKEGEEPMEEHARQYSRCPHMILVKGKQFVGHITPTNNDGTNSEERKDSNGKSQIGKKKDEDASESNGGIGTKDSGDSSGSDSNDSGDSSGSDSNDSGDSSGSDSNDSGDSSGSNSNDSGDRSGSYNNGSGDSVDIKEIEIENRDIKKRLYCQQCNKGLADILFIPCGHLVTCGMCAPSLQQCQTCGQSIKGLKKIYLNN